MQKKQPWFKFHTTDWLGDEKLSCCSLAAQGLWIRMLCFMHKGDPYGHLKLGNLVIQEDKLSVILGVKLDEFQKAFKELKETKVVEKTEDGIWFSRRMVRDHENRLKKAQNGRKGGNPQLVLDNQEDNHEVNQDVNREVKPRIPESQKKKKNPESGREGAVSPRPFGGPSKPPPRDEYDPPPKARPIGAAIKKIVEAAKMEGRTE